MILFTNNAFLTNFHQFVWKIRNGKPQLKFKDFCKNNAFFGATSIFELFFILLFLHYHDTFKSTLLQNYLSYIDLILVLMVVLVAFLVLFKRLLGDGLPKIDGLGVVHKQTIIFRKNVLLVIQKSASSFWNYDKYSSIL